MTNTFETTNSFNFSIMVEAQRGMTDAEAEQFLITGVMPDLSQPAEGAVTAAAVVPQVSHSERTFVIREISPISAALATPYGYRAYELAQQLVREDVDAS